MNSLIIDVSIIAAVMTLLTALISFMNNAVLANRMRKVQADKDIMDLLTQEVKSQKLIIGHLQEDKKKLKSQFDKVYLALEQKNKEVEVYQRFNDHLST